MREINLKTATQRDTPRRSIIYGETGCGKTTSLKTIPDWARPVYVLDIDEKADMLLGQNDMILGQFDRFDMSKVKPVEDGDFSELTKTDEKEPLLYLQIKRKIKQLHTDENIKTIVIDSWTLMNSATIDRIRYKNKRSDFDQTTQPDYGVNIGLNLNLIYDLLQTGKNLILLCHEDITESATTGMNKGTPAIVGQLGLLIPRFFKDVIHATVKIDSKGPTYLWETKPGRIFIASTATPNLPAEMPPDFGVLWKR